MKNCCLKLNAGAGCVGCAKYARVGIKEGNVGAVNKENQICKWVFSLDLTTYFCTGVFLVPWLQISGELNVGRSPGLW
jgi:hypothetical protein